MADQDYAKLLLKYPWLLSTSFQENYAELLSFSYSIKVPFCSVMITCIHLISDAYVTLVIITERKLRTFI